MKTAWLNPSGGLGYHFKAWRYRDRLWNPFAQSLGLWLLTWEIKNLETLLWFGPSGGYCVPASFVQKFKRVICVDPDPLARWILTRKIPTVEWDRADYLGPDSKGRWRVERLLGFLKKHPGATVLWSNLLGQLGVLYGEAVEEESFSAWKKALSAAMQGHEWASFHDRLSGWIAPKVTSENATAPEALSPEALLQLFYRTSPALQGTDKIFELEDHFTEELFMGHGGVRSYWVWELAPGNFHLIEGVRG